MECKEEIYSGHAVRQMFARKISRVEVSELLRNGEAIEEYKDDKPFPSYLVLGFVGGRALHVVVAVERKSQKCHIVTAYDPNPDIWEEGFKKRRR